MDLKEETYSQKALRLVCEYLQDKGILVDENEVKIVWFCKTIQNWKSLVAHLAPGGMYYEVTYNGDKKETYIDAYKKFNNVVIADD